MLETTLNEVLQMVRDAQETNVKIGFVVNESCAVIVTDEGIKRFIEVR